MSIQSNTSNQSKLQHTIFDKYKIFNKPFSHICY